MTQGFRPDQALVLKAPSAVEVARFVTPLGALAGAGAYALGASRSSAAIGDRFEATVRGTVILEAGAALPANSLVKSDATGRAIPWDGTGVVLGQAYESAFIAGQYVEVRLATSPR